MATQQVATFQEALEMVESLPEARAEYARGEVTQGTVENLMKELAE